jgi:site-specific DNA-methyltransferase (adenine-specific)
MSTAEIIHGDALDVLRGMPDASVDAVVMDPPYCSGGFSEAARRQAKGQGLRSETIRAEGWFASDNMGTSGLMWLMRQTCREANRILRSSGSMIVFTDWRQVVNIVPPIESTGFRYTNCVVWDKGSAGLGAGFRAQHEMALHFTKGSPVYHDRSTGNVIRCPRQNHNTREHQTQKPVAIMASLVRVVAPIAGTVLDPFAGSGSTGVACVETGRSFIGIEREATYVEIARRRIADAQAQASLLDGAA